MKRHHIVGIIAGICGCLLAIHQGFFRGMITDAIITFIGISFVAISTFFKDKYPPQLSRRILPRWILIVIFILTVIMTIWNYSKGGTQEVVAPNGLQTPTSLERELVSVPDETDISDETGATAQPSTRQKIANILKGDHFTKQVTESLKTGTMPEPLTSVPKFQEYLVEQGMTEVQDIDFTNYFQNVFQKYFPGKVPSDLDTQMKEKFILSMRGRGYEKATKEFTKDPKNIVWLTARFDPIPDMGEALGKWSERLIADEFGDKTIDEILGVPSMISKPVGGEQSTSAPITEIRRDKEAQDAILQKPVETSQRYNIKGNMQPISPENMKQDLAKIEPELLKSLTHQDFENFLREQPNSERFSLQRFNNAMQTLNRYGSKEGLRKLKELDPVVATQIERFIKEKGSKRVSK